MKFKKLSTIMAIALSIAMILPNTVYAAAPEVSVSENDAGEQDEKEKVEEVKEVKEDETDDKDVKEKEEKKEEVKDDTKADDKKADDAKEDEKDKKEASEEEDVILTEEAAIQGSGVTWQIDGTTLKIAGSGEMPDLMAIPLGESIYGQPWYDYRGTITKITIGASVTSIGAHAFEGLSKLSEVEIPSNVKKIGFAAFCNDKALTNASIASGMIGESAFINCEGLKKVTIGSGVTDIGISAFENNKSLARVDIQDLTSWCKIYFGGIYANPLEFAGDLYVNGTKLTTLSVPEGIEVVPNYAFTHAKSITSVTIPSTVKEIGEYAFYHCDALSNLTVQGSSLKKIGGYAFESCNKLVLHETPASVTYYGPYCFRYCPLGQGDGKLKIPAGYIGKGAFDQCGAFNDLTFGDKITYIGEGAFNKNGAMLENGKVTYLGSQERWNAVTKAAGNDSIVTRPITCSGTSKPDDSLVYNYRTEATFGTYKGANIDWIILEEKNGKAFVISKNIIEFTKFDESDTDLTWADSGIRAWLNSSFMNAAFTADQKSKIQTTSVSTPANSRYGTTGGAATSDKIFLLSSAEVEKYFPYNEEAAAKCTAIAYSNSKKDAAISNPDGSDAGKYFGSTSYWWLRSRGMYKYEAEYVDYLGYVHKDGMSYANFITGVRPAMWVDKSALKIKKTGAEAFVERLYTVIFGREAEAKGLKDWTNRLNSKTETGAEVAKGFITSQEFLNKNTSDSAYVTKLYRAFFDREPDFGGYNMWMSRLATGADRNTVLAGFTNSDEFKNLCNKYGINQGKLDFPGLPTGDDSRVGQFMIIDSKGVDVNKLNEYVERMYTKILGRPGEAKGMKYWREEILSGDHYDAGTAARVGFFTSTEYLAKNKSDDEFIKDAYAAFFNRKPDQSGYDYWVKALKSGEYTRDSMIDVGFGHSTEFKNLLKSYGFKITEK